MKLKLDASNRDQSDGNRFNVEKLSEFWQLNARGVMSASLSAKIGPVVTIIVAPGFFATLNPWIMGEVSLQGEMNYVKASGKPSEDLPPMAVPTQVDCPGAPVQNQTFDNDVPSTAEGPGAPDPQGKGFTVSGKAFERALTDRSNMCLAAGVALVPGLHISGIGPPVAQLEAAFKGICEEMAAWIKDVSDVLAPPIDCVGKQIVGPDFPGIANGGVEFICDEALKLLRKSPLDAITFVDTEIHCFDIWSDYIGDPICT